MMIELLLDLRRYDRFNVDYCFTSGQIFGWKKIDGFWYGITNNKLLKICQKENILYIYSNNDVNEKEVVNFLGLEDCKRDIDRKLAQNLFMKSAISRYSEARILRQDPINTIISYICAQNKNIPAIEKMIFELSRKFGTEKKMDRMPLYALPDINKISNLCLSDLLSVGLGYRAKYLLETARRIHQDNTFFEKIKKTEYYNAWNKIVFGDMKLAGVGPKVADCILLYGFGKMEAFPIDIWIFRAYTTAMRGIVDKESLESIQKILSDGKKVNRNLYLKLGDLARNTFGKYAGYAQLYIYMYGRDYFRYL